MNVCIDQSIDRSVRVEFLVTATYGISTELHTMVVTCFCLEKQITVGDGEAGLVFDILATSHHRDFGVLASDHVREKYSIFTVDSCSREDLLRAAADT